MHYIMLTLERCKWFAFHPRLIQKGRRKDEDFVVLLMQDHHGQRAHEVFTLFSERSPFVGKSTPVFDDGRQRTRCLQARRVEVFPEQMGDSGSELALGHFYVLPLP